MTALSLIAGCAPLSQPADPTVLRPRQAVIEVPGPLPNPQETDCARNEFLKSVVPKVTTEIIRSERVHLFFDDLPHERIQEIEGVALGGSVLTIRASARGRFLEFQGPISDTIESSRYEASPGVAVVAHTLTLGLGLIFAPVKSAQHALGCTDRRVVRQAVRSEDSRPTGGAVWRPMPAPMMFRIEGLGPARDYGFEYVPGTDGRFRVDLIDAIVAQDIDQGLTLQISCLSCAGDPNESASGRRSRVELKADVRAVRASELERRERLAQAARAAQLERARTEAALERAREALAGRWSTREHCVHGEREDVGWYFERSESTGLRSRRVVAQGDRSATRDVAERVELSVVDVDQGLIQASLALRALGSQRIQPVQLRFRIEGEQMSLISLIEGTNERIRAGLRLPDGRPAEPLYNCAHPLMAEARAAANRARVEAARQAEARRLQQEREAAERRRIEEAQRIELERAAEAARRAQEERRRRQDI
ncbi:MAG: hypothetical protein RL322_2935 [Pseudomonadota bacterium]|jgi:hypothetical protein